MRRGFAPNRDGERCGRYWPLPGEGRWEPTASKFVFCKNNVEIGLLEFDAHMHAHAHTHTDSSQAPTAQTGGRSGGICLPSTVLPHISPACGRRGWPTQLPREEMSLHSRSVSVSVHKLNRGANRFACVQNSVTPFAWNIQDVSSFLHHFNRARRVVVFKEPLPDVFLAK